ncbi:MAG: hypothetical protein CMJ81_11715 [Planctomycetaceae bacterium]|nr:hypothetical protein [Planctomycetaceae bacterium]MBP63980.1 hypothetical protein [Planctomycetaceae bacterium]
MKPGALIPGEQRMRITDDIVKDQDLLRAVSDPEALTKLGTYNWWDGWWRCDPRNAFEELIQLLWNDQGLPETVAGFEYWNNVNQATGGVGWHRDCDEKTRAASGRVITPMAGQVYYMHVENLSGGFLEVSDAQNMSLISSETLERVRPKTNRMIYHDPSLLHRVSPVHAGLRHAFLANVWNSKPATFDLGDCVDAQFQPV